MIDQTVALLMAAVALFGTAIGLRFKVYILIPAGAGVLMVSVVAQLISNKMAGWGVQGTIGLLVLLNAGFVLGLLLRAGLASWSKRSIARLFARSSNVDQKMRRPDVAGREASGEGPTATISPRDLAKESFRR
jgi:predicted histidine transporter YuiF (NhaC family)